jgi:hypothetical protein
MPIGSRRTPAQPLAEITPVNSSDDGKPTRRFRSATIYDGLIRSTTRSFLHGLGQGDDEIARPHLAVIHTGGEMSPCNTSLAGQAQHAKTGSAGRSWPLIVSAPAPEALLAQFDGEAGERGIVRYTSGAEPVGSSPCAPKNIGRPR